MGDAASRAISAKVEIVTGIPENAWAAEEMRLVQLVKTAMLAFFVV
jgi:hypothetical protein